MLSTKPYLVRAFYEWIIDNTCTPYIAISVASPRCTVPQEHVKDGEIIFNIAPQAVRDLKIGNDMLEFKASFSGVVRVISAPIKSILAIYAEENGQGMFFDSEEDEVGGDWPIETASPQKADSSTKDKKQSAPSYLRLVE
jgi:stringent starvation protein B